MLHSVYDQPDAQAVNAEFDRTLDYVTEKLPKVAEHLDTARAPPTREGVADYAIDPANAERL